MKRIRILSFVALSWAASCAFAAPPADKSANDDWLGLNTLMRPRNPTRPSAEDPKQSVAQQEIDRLLELAAQAGGFASKHAQDSRAAGAKKLGVMAGLQAVQLGAVEKKQAILALAKAYRRAPQNPIRDRFDVALTMEVMDFEPAAPSPRKDGARFEKTADTLYEEFGDVDEAYKYYLSVGRTADNATAGRIGRKLLAMPSAPTWAKVQARAIAERDALLNQPIDLTLTPIEGKSFNLKAAAKQPVVLIVWDASAGISGLPTLTAVKSKIPGGESWVYLAFGNSPGSSAELKAQAPFPGTHCLIEQGWRSREARALKVQQLPFAYVIDAKGNVAGFGPVAEIPELLESATR